MVTEGLSTGKTILIGTVVLGCFAVLWPKIFMPMLFGEPEHPTKHSDHPMRGSSEQHNFVHPALRSEAAGKSRPGPGSLMGGGGENKLFHGEEGRQMRKPMEFRPGPVPGMRPSMGGPGMQPPQQKGGQGSMGILMPIYTIGIVIFFLYTVMKIMFKRDNEQDEKYDQQQQQQQQKMRGAPHQYAAGDTYDEANIRMRQFQQQQQQQQRMQHMQKVNSHKQAYPNSISSPLSPIPETYPRSPRASANLQNMSTNEHVNTSTNAPSSPSFSTSLISHFTSGVSNLATCGNNLAQEEDDDTTCISNVMEGLINVAESVVASKSSTGSEFGDEKDTLHQEELQQDLREDEISVLKRKLEETQRAMAQIMEQVNRVSTEINDPVNAPLTKISGNNTQESEIHAPKTFNEKEESTKFEGKSAEPIGQNLAEVSHVKTNECPEPTLRTCDKMFKEEAREIENIGVENVGTNDEKYQGQNNCSTSLTSNDNVCLPGTEQNEDEIIDTTFGEQSVDPNECSESDSGIQQHYETTDFLSHNSYEDEAGYSYYYEDVHYDEEDENESDTDDELEVYNQIVNSKPEAYLYAARTEYTNDPVENIHKYPEEASQQILDSFNLSEEKIQENPTLEDTIQNQDEETESPHIQARPEIEEILNENDCIDTNLKTIIPNEVTSVYHENKDYDEYDKQSNEQYTAIGTRNLSDVCRNDEINDSQASHQHRKSVELIHNDEEDNDGDVQCEEKAPKTFLSNHNTKNRRRKKLRKT